MIEVNAGNTGKMAILYEKYKMPLYAYYFKVTGGDRQASEDLVHTVFYRVIRYRNTFTGQGSFVSWLFRIAHNTGLDNLRSQKLHETWKREISYRQTNYYEMSDLEKDERYAILNLAMSKLKPHERELLVLGKIENLKQREIAEILGMSESNVKIRTFRALNKLKKIYSKIETNSYERTGLRWKTG